MQAGAVHRRYDYVRRRPHQPPRLPAPARAEQRGAGAALHVLLGSSRRAVRGVLPELPAASARRRPLRPPQPPVPALPHRLDRESARAPVRVRPRPDGGPLESGRRAQCHAPAHPPAAAAVAASRRPDARRRLGDRRASRRDRPCRVSHRRARLTTPCEFAEPRGKSREESVMANVLTVVAKIRAAQGKGDALAALLKGQVAAVMKAEPGCLVYRPHRSTKDPDLFVFYEQYKDDAAFDAHRKAPHLAAYRERREKEGLTQGAAEVEIFRSLTD